VAFAADATAQLSEAVAHVAQITRAAVDVLLGIGVLPQETAQRFADQQKENEARADDRPDEHVGPTVARPSRQPGALVAPTPRPRVAARRQPALRHGQERACAATSMRSEVGKQQLDNAR